MSTSRWDSHWKKHGKGSPSPFAATPSHRQQWLAQLGRLKQKAAFRRAKQEAQQQSHVAQQQSQATQQGAGAGMNQSQPSQQQPQPSQQQPQPSQLQSQSARQKPEATDDEPEALEGPALSHAQSAEAADAVEGQEQQRQHDPNSPSQGTAHQASHQQAPTATTSGHTSEPVDPAELTQHDAHSGSWNTAQHQKFAAGSGQLVEQQHGEQQQQPQQPQQQLQQQQQAQQCYGPANAVHMDPGVHQAELQPEAQSLGTAVLERGDMPSSNALADAPLDTTLSSRLAHAEGRNNDSDKSATSLAAPEIVEDATGDAGEGASQYSHQSDGSFATATDRVQGQLAGLRRRAARKSQQ